LKREEAGKGRLGVSSALLPLFTHKEVLGKDAFPLKIMKILAHRKWGWAQKNPLTEQTTL
jgi:hypothetical protein